MALIFDSGNMFFRGKWEFCEEYEPGDVVARANVTYVAIKRSAGYDPIISSSAEYWMALGTAMGGGGITEHNDLYGREEEDTHPISAISGLAAAIDAKLDASAINSMYRGTFTSAEELRAARPTDEPGAYATVVSPPGEQSIWIWSDDAGDWEDSGVAGVWVESVNGKTGPLVALSASDVGAVPAAAVNVPGGVAGLGRTGRF